MTIFVRLRNNKLEGEDSAQIVWWGIKGREEEKEGRMMRGCEVMQPKRNVISPPARLARWC